MPLDIESAAWFRARLTEWFPANQRRFPWRDTDHAFHLLLAELMLRRTQARQVVPVYATFIAKFPDPLTLATASEADVAAALRPLGLAWRVPAFRHLATILVDRHNGSVPRDRVDLVALPGVGDYVASAVRAVAFRLHDPVYDTNTVRVAGRYFGFPTHAESRRRRPVQQAVDRLFSPEWPRESTLALLDFAALVCRAPRPRCESCPVSRVCVFAKASDLSIAQRSIPDPS